MTKARTEHGISLIFGLKPPKFTSGRYRLAFIPESVTAPWWLMPYRQEIMCGDPFEYCGELASSRGARYDYGRRVGLLIDVMENFCFYFARLMDIIKKAGKDWLSIEEKVKKEIAVDLANKTLFSKAKFGNYTDFELPRLYQFKSSATRFPFFRQDHKIKINMSQLEDALEAIKECSNV